ncbi:UNVERIFIED_CONTAM: hypothetical protein K2H54_062927 [Gekko kuhli]
MTPRKKKPRGPEMEETLCCCEYLDRTGERSHLAACLCNCEDLDECCERGAVRIDISLLPPIILLPVFLHIAALHILLAFIILISLPVLVLWYYYLTHRKKGRTLFFLSLGLFSLGYMYFVFLLEVVPRGHVGHSQVTILTCGLILMLVALSRAKRDPGYLCCQMSDEKALCQGNNNNIISSWNGLGSANGLYRVAPSGTATNSHINVYGISLTLDSICKGKATIKALFYCPGVYSDYSSALSFTCVWYCAIVTSGMGYILLIQLLNISYNVTEREARIALRENSGRRLLCGMVVDTGQYNRGVLHNWIQFISLGSLSLQHSTEAIV